MWDTDLIGQMFRFFWAGAIALILVGAILAVVYNITGFLVWAVVEIYEKAMDKKMRK